jgi:hypothetical protein
MTKPKNERWNLERINEMRRTGVEESLSLDYKAAAALDRSNAKTPFELTKDVSAFANSAGGVLIYGVREDPANRHLPGDLDPIIRSAVSKEWLESIILTVQPRIDDLEIHPVPIDSEHALYVIEVPKSTTAHQARDHKYYKRSNFSAHPMEDYEIRDVMSRLKHPHIILSFELERYVPQNFMGMPDFGRKNKKEEALSVEVTGENRGPVLAKYVIATIAVPIQLVEVDELVRRGYRSPEELPEGLVFTVTNKKQRRNSTGLAISDPRYEPILPTLALSLGDFNLGLDALLTTNQDLEIIWQVHADNAPPVKGKTRLGDINVIDKR